MRPSASLLESGPLIPVRTTQNAGSITLTLTWAPTLLRWCSFVPPHIRTKYGMAIKITPTMTSA